MNDFERYDHPTTPPAWKELRAILKPLEPFDELYQAFYQGAWDRIKSMSDHQIDALMKAIRYLSSSNCGWTMYQAGQLIARDVEREADHRIAEIAKEVEDIAALVIATHDPA